MTQQVLKSRVMIPSNVPQIDAATLDFIWVATGSNPNIDFTAAINPDTVINDFFNSGVGAGAAVGTLMSNDLTRTSNACTISYTDVTAHLDGTPAGSPFRTVNFTLTSAASGNTMPPDAALVCSYHSDYGSNPEKGPFATLPTPDEAQDYGAPPTHLGQTKPRARLRGRFYLGPLNSQSTLGPQGLVLPSAITSTMGPSLNRLLNLHNVGAATQFELQIWSRRNAGVSDPTHYYVSEGFGTVRRRGDVALNRVHNWTPITESGP